jgi:hypothetical protein
MSHALSRAAERFVVAAVMVGLVCNMTRAAENHAVDFRLVHWKSVHLHDASEATKIEKTLRELGCETARDQHGDHIDVSYRCPQWRRMTAKSHDEAHRWQDWLKAKGFETRHGH